MAEYIDRDLFLKNVKHNAPFIYSIVSPIALITPPADVAPVVPGRWEKWNGDDRHHCTVCECYANAERDSYGYIAYEFLDNYCPNCGARMNDA